MKLNNKFFIGAVVAFAASIGFSSCTDNIAFGNAFLEKAPGSTATEDTVFNNPEYTRQFLAGIYTLQYYGLPWRSSNDAPQSANYFNGQVEALSDCFHLPFSGCTIWTQYYQGSYNASAASTVGGVYGFRKENVWVLVHRAYELIEK